MKLDHKEIADGLHDGKEVWICDLRYKDFNNKPIRKQLPKKVTILSAEGLNKRVNYSNSYFQEGGKKSSIIKLYDNTGYRWYTGIPLNVFTSEKECNMCFDKLVEEVLKEFEEYKSRQIRYLERIESELKELI